VQIREIRGNTCLPNTGGWFVRVFNLEPYHKNPKFDWCQVNVYDGSGRMLGDEQGFACRP
jgi:hypothetical protein